MNYIDLFSGIGGFALGAYWAGVRFEKHYFSEVDAYCNSIYSLRFPTAIPLGDIKKINVETMLDNKKEWIITGGFPCQDISIAGKGEGIKGERSGLWFAMFDVIRILRPRFAIIENVGAITHRGLDTVLGCLAEIGYDAEWQDIRASDVGAPHRRERIWILAYPGDGTDRTDRGKEREKDSIPGKCGEAGCSRVFGGTSENSEDVANPDKGQCDRQEKEVRTRGNSINIGSQDVANTSIVGCNERANKQGKECKEVRGSEPTECSKTLVDTNKERLQGFGEQHEYNEKETRYSVGVCSNERSRSGQWLPEPDVGRLAHGVSRRVDRLKGLGNSIVPQIAELLFRQIKEVLKGASTGS